MILVILFMLFSFVIVATVITILVRSSLRASGDDRNLSMRFRESFLNVVPKPARTMASVVVVCAVVVGTTFGIIEARRVDAAPSLLGIAAGLFVGSVFAIWVLGLGYVYADARRRNMPHIPWTLVAMVVPNLLGFLLYFVLRKPLASPCPQCGQPKTPEQLFCPWCGYHVLSQPAAPPPPQTI